MPTTEEFTGMSWDEVETHTPDDLWLVPEMISNTSTLLYGESESGKSFLASALIAALTAGTDFLGRDIVGGPYRVGVGFTDDQGDREYKTRILSARQTTDDPGVRFYRVPVMRHLSQWSTWLRKLKDHGIDVLVIDNMTQCADGDLNTNPAVRDFFEGVRMIVDAGIPVIVLGHSTQKSSPQGGKSELPMGHSAIVQSVRWRVFAKRFKDDTIKLTFAGNSARKHDLTVRHGDGANFTYVDHNDAEDRLENERKREQRTHDEYRDVAEFVIRECQGMGVNKVADACVAKFGKSKTTYKNQLSLGGGTTDSGKVRKPGRLAYLLDRTPEDNGFRWEWKAPQAVAA